MAEEKKGKPDGWDLDPIEIFFILLFLIAIVGSIIPAIFKSFNSGEFSFYGLRFSSASGFLKSALPLLKAAGIGIAVLAALGVLLLKKKANAISQKTAKLKTYSGSAKSAISQAGRRAGWLGLISFLNPFKIFSKSSNSSSSGGKAGFLSFLNPFRLFSKSSSASKTGSKSSFLSFLNPFKIFSKSSKSSDSSSGFSASSRRSAATALGGIGSSEASSSSAPATGKMDSVSAVSAGAPTVQSGSATQGEPSGRVVGRWQRIIELSESENSSDWRLSVIEADIILDELLEKLQLPGDTMADKLKAVEESDFNTIESAWEAHKFRNNIAHQGSDFLVNRREIRRIISLYETVFREFNLI